MKVFLSHSTKDADFVEKLATALADNGFTPWRCEVDIDKGENFVAKINQGLAQSDLALLIWSQHAANSAWTLEEWTAVLARQVEENRIRLGLVLLCDCPMPLPPLLRTKNYVDARADVAAGIDGVLGWLKKRQQAQRLSGLSAPMFLPDYRPQDFVGRASYLEVLRTSLTAEPTEFLLYGGPGSGKSTLALRYAWEAQKDFDAVVFQTCGKRSLEVVASDLANQLRKQLGEDVLKLPPEQKLAATKEWLKARQSLLVLDDVWSSEVKQLEPGPACSVLYSSRLKSLPWISTSHSAEVVSFSDLEAEELFHTYLDPTFGNEEVLRNRDGLLDFAKRVECLPIAVAVGASMLREKSASALGRAVLKIKLDALADGAKDVNALLRTAIESQPNHERRLLAAGAVCVQEGFWLPLAAEIAGLSEDEADDAADTLVHSSLLRVADRERRRFQLHALLRDEVPAWKGDGIVKLRERHAATLEKLFKDWETRWRDCSECLAEVIPAVEFMEMRGERRRGWRLSFLGCELGRRTGELETALRIMQQEEAIAEAAADKSTLQASYGNQANILHAWGRLEEAMTLYKKQEATCVELDNRNDLQISYGNQAVILKDWGRLEEAVALHKKEEDICIELGNRDGLQRSYGNRAVALQAWGRLEEALALHKREEEICVELGNKDGLQRSYGNQALILQDWRRLEEALALHKKAEAIAVELGDKQTLQAIYGNQAGILIQRKRLKEALILLQKSEKICLGLGLRSGLAHCYLSWVLLARAQGDRKTEKEKLEQALAIFTELKMPRERDAVQAELEKVAGG
jgi:tetratricopeptide (TPR) repeat protein